MSSPIPDDWDGQTWECYLVAWPKSTQWGAILRGFITTPTRGRFWDANSGSITDAQAVGRLITEENAEMQCNDLLTVLGEIRDKIADIDVTNQSQVTVQTNINNNVNLVATLISQAIAAQSQSQSSVSISVANAQAFAYAWSQSFAQSLVGVSITNNYPSQLRPILPDVGSEPTTEEQTSTGITPVHADPSQTELCKRVFWLLDNVRQIILRIDATKNWINSGVLAVLGSVADAVTVSAITKAGAPTKRYLIPASVLLQAVHLIAQLITDNHFLDWIGEVKSAYENNFDSLYLSLYCAAAEGLATDEIQAGVTSEWANWLSNQVGVAVMTLFFNLSVLASLYYEGAALDDAPDVPSEYAYLCALTCGPEG